MHATAHFGDLAGGRVEGGASGDFRLEGDARAHDLERIRSLDHGVDVGDRVDRPVAGERPLADMTPDDALGLQCCQGLAKDRAPDIQRLRQLAFGRQSPVVRQVGARKEVS